MGPFLFGALIALVMTGFIGIIFPFGRTMDLVMAIGGCLIFSGYIVYDTYTINKRLSPDEYIMGAISLYLEYVPFISHLLHLMTDVLPFSFINLCEFFFGRSYMLSVNYYISPQHSAPPQQYSGSLGKIVE